MIALWSQLYLVSIVGFCLGVVAAYVAAGNVPYV